MKRRRTFNLEILYNLAVTLYMSLRPVYTMKLSVMDEVSVQTGTVLDEQQSNRRL